MEQRLARTLIRPQKGLLTMERLKRLEIAFEDGVMVGAQATVEQGTMDGRGKFLKTGEVTFGLDTGNFPEYETALVSAAGMAATQAIDANVDLRSKVTQLEENKVVLVDEKATIVNERDLLIAASVKREADIVALRAELAAKP